MYIVLALTPRTKTAPTSSKYGVGTVCLSPNPAYTRDILDVALASGRAVETAVTELATLAGDRVDLGRVHGLAGGIYGHLVYLPDGRPVPVPRAAQDGLPLQLSCGRLRLLHCPLIGVPCAFSRVV